MNTNEYTIKDPVIGPLMYSGSFFKSKTAATGIPKLDTGPQKWVVSMYLNVFLLNMFRNDIKWVISEVISLPARMLTCLGRTGTLAAGMRRDYVQDRIQKWRRLAREKRAFQSACNTDHFCHLLVIGRHTQVVLQCLVLTDHSRFILHRVPCVVCLGCFRKGL